MSKNPKHSELELKLAADDVDVKIFSRWCFSHEPTKYVHLTSPDTYYTQGDNVLRHRHGGKTAGELTVKRRTSKRSTRNRLEIDLRFDSQTTHDDVERFLVATGWEPAFNVFKDCHIFWLDEKKPGVEIVLYDVRCIFPNGKETSPRRFVEIEIHKADSNHPKALTTLKDWERAARRAFALGAVQTESLYEIYSGKRYGMVKR